MSYKTLQQVVNKLAELDSEYTNSPLKKAVAFNHAYWVISKNILKNKTFENPQMMQKLDVDFAEYYFKQVNPAWNTYFTICKSPFSNSLICLAIGGYIHINKDLPLSLKKYPPTENDYQKVQTIINQSLPEILDFLGYRHFQQVYISIMKFILIQWRSNAWKKGV